MTTCPLCRGDLTPPGESTDTTGMNAVCDPCLRPLCERLGMALIRGGGTAAIRVMRVEPSPEAGGSYYQVFATIELMEGT